jgi:hypothetical protein
LSRNSDDEEYLGALTKGCLGNEQLFVFNQGSKEIKALQVENTAQYKNIHIVFYNFNALYRIT